MKMTSLVLILLINLALFWASAQGHPISTQSRQARSTSTSQHDLLKDFTDGLIKLKNVTQEDDTSGAVATMLQLFNFTCRTHISVMTLKMQMQRYLFNESATEALNNKSGDFFKNINNILSTLETAAATLQEIQVATVGYGCIEFASDEYYQIYDDDAITDKEVLKKNVDEWEKFEILANKLARNTLSITNTLVSFIKSK